MARRVAADGGPTRRRAFVALLLAVSCVYGVYFRALGGPAVFVQRAAEESPPVWREAPDGGCLLPVIDPWDAAMRRFLRPPVWPPCAPTHPQRSRLFFDGTLEVEGRPGDECFHRCLEMPDDRRLLLGEWVRGERTPAGHWTAAPACDVLEVKCARADGNTTFKFMHSQIAPRPARPEQAVRQAPTDFPDVHVLVLDSVSMTHARRALPRTLAFLERRLGARRLEFLNKVGMNSAPNAYGFLLGERAEDLPASPAGPAVGGGQWRAICRRGLRGRHWIGRDFAHYRSLLNEDAGRTVFHHPNCRGFGHRPADHNTRALMLQLDGRRTVGNPPPDPAFARLLTAASCREKHHLVLHHLDQFLRRYPHEPKFSLSWITRASGRRGRGQSGLSIGGTGGLQSARPYTLAHKKPDDLYHGDADLLAFFRRHEQRLQNAFVFLMGDHGPSYGELRNTPTGRLEANNPLLVLTLPAHLRANGDLGRQLEANGRRLVSHYDVYATLLEIAEKGNEWTERTAFSSTSFRPTDRRLLGASLLHPLPGPRDCHSLRIPFQYCLCQAAQRPSADSRTAALIAEAAVARMNAELAAAGFDLLCAHLSLDPAWPPEIYELGGGHFKVVLRALPRGAVHEAFARVADGRVEFLVDTFPQLTQYNQFAFCIPRGLFLQNYCYCGPRKSGQRVGRFGQFLLGNDTR